MVDDEGFMRAIVKKLDEQGKRPISGVNFRGTNHTLVPYNGGNFNGGVVPSAMEDFDQWKMLNECPGEPESSDNDICKHYSNCKDGVEVWLCSPAADHFFYSTSASQGLVAVDLAWEVFKRHRLPKEFL